MRPRRDSSVVLTELERYLIERGELPGHDEHHKYTGSSVDVFRMAHASLDGPCARYDAFARFWALHRAAFMAAWAGQHPGVRPFAWWLIDAPRKRVDGVATRAPEPRRQVGGSGHPSDVGISGTALAMSRGVLRFVDVDPEDPPLVESEAAYLERHGLLVDGERERLADDAFEPALAVELFRPERLTAGVS